MKRSIDIAFSLVLLPVALVILLPLAILIWLWDRQPPIYAGARVGRDWKPYRQYKLRSMIVDADRAGIDATPENDPRITPIGRFMRRHKLDEIPQLWNVLKGEMSLVGPRPNCMRECEMYSVNEKRILAITPGITDIASIVFSDEERIIKVYSDPDLGYHQLIRPWKSRFCLLYLEQRSTWIDLKILAVTALVPFSRRLALARLQHVLRSMDAGPDLLTIARREQSLAPAIPPGMTTIVYGVNKRVEAA